ncbi:hypothetical protein CK203_034703 [Vitis vinifera]|uniref:Uncharacterized protein n=1 Tax=Vitis vinifera TaxID=29760 RepID=A0A438HWD5_VITVI|nr:hypothetical protein CK203_034703 [Vitis vinifera]
MMFFLKMQGKRVWNSIEYGWRPPFILDAQGRSTEFVQMSFAGLQIANVQRNHEICFKSLMKATWSDTNSEESATTTSQDARYDPNDLLAFIASVESVHDSNCDSDSDDNEFTDERRAEFLNNLVVEHERLIKSYMKDHDILEAHKNKIDMLNVEKTNLLEKIRFLESEHHSLFEKNNALS